MCRIPNSPTIYYLHTLSLQSEAIALPYSILSSQSLAISPPYSTFSSLLNSLIQSDLTTTINTTLEFNYHIQYTRVPTPCIPCCRPFTRLQLKYFPSPCLLLTTPLLPIPLLTTTTPPTPILNYLASHSRVFNYNTSHPHAYNPFASHSFAYNYYASHSHPQLLSFPFLCLQLLYNTSHSRAKY